MKQLRIMVIGFALIAAGFTSCGQNKDANGAGDASAEEAAPVAGTMMDGPGFRVLIPEGWEKSLFEAAGSLQTSRRDMKYAVKVQRSGMNMTQNDIDVNLKSIADRYKGTPIKTVDLLGLKFIATTFDMGGMRQTMYLAIKDGQAVNITLMGPDHETDPTVQAVFKSIALK